MSKRDNHLQSVGVLAIGWREQGIDRRFSLGGLFADYSKEVPS